MERKNYLVEELSEEEDKYIKVSIKKGYLKFIRNNFKELNVKKYLIDDVNIQDKIPAIEESYFNVDLCQIDQWDLDYKYSKKQQDICVQKLNSLAIQSGLEKYIRTLTYNEKLVFFLLNIQCLSINKTSFLISVDWETVKRRKKSADRKIGEEKNKNGKR
ncbi:MAG: hypothetical protein J6D03_11365 [Clostridia bacterium]|nr:hypothetical protein [Clostridia bacterium]